MCVCACVQVCASVCLEYTRHAHTLLRGERDVTRADQFASFIPRLGQNTGRVKTSANRYNTDKKKSNPRPSMSL